MTLSDWTEKTDNHSRVYSAGNGRMVVCARCTDPHFSDLYHLADYVLTTQGGEVQYLTLRAEWAENAAPLMLD